VSGRDGPELAVAAVDELAEATGEGRRRCPPHLPVHEAQLLRDDLVEDDPADGRHDPLVDEGAGRVVPGADADLDRLVQAQGDRCIDDVGPRVADRERGGRAAAAARHAAARELVREEGRLLVRERARRRQVAVAVALRDIRGEVVAAQDHILRRRDDRAPVGRRQQVRG
jgi:hypothetical protein